MRCVLPFFVGFIIGLHCQAQSVRDFPPPRPTPIPDANPAIRAEQDVLVPTTFKVFRTADVIVVRDDHETLKPIKLMVGSKMILGMSTELYIYPVGGVRRAEPNMGSLGTLRGNLGELPGKKFSGAGGYFYPKRDGLLVPGKPCILELEVVIFETDIPGGHFWMPHGNKYKVLWRTTLKQTVEERPQLPDEIREEMERVKPQPVTPPSAPTQSRK